MTVMCVLVTSKTENTGLDLGSSSRDAAYELMPLTRSWWKSSSQNGLQRQDVVALRRMSASLCRYLSDLLDALVDLSYQSQRLSTLENGVAASCDCPQRRCLTENGARLSQFSGDGSCQLHDSGVAQGREGTPLAAPDPSSFASTFMHDISISDDMSL